MLSFYQSVVLLPQKSFPRSGNETDSIVDLTKSFIFPAISVMKNKKILLWGPKSYYVLHFRPFFATKTATNERFTFRVTFYLTKETTIVDTVGEKNGVQETMSSN